MTAFSIDSIIDSFVAKFSLEAIAKLPLWMRPIARKILEAFTELNLDAALKSLIDEWLSGDQSEPLPMFAMKRLAADDAPQPVGIDPFTILTLISLAIKIFSLLRQPPVVGAEPGSVETLTDDDSEIEAAFTQALAA